MRRLVIHTDEARALMGWGRTKAYEEFAQIRALYPGSNALRSRRSVLIRDFANYHQLTEEDVHGCFTDQLRP